MTAFIAPDGAAMITVDYVRTMAGYNASLNGRVFAAAERLPESARRQDRGAFWHSIHGTLSHLVWADQMWMSRFAGWDAPGVKLAESGGYVDGFEAMVALRSAMDQRLQDWAATLYPAWLEGQEHWFSGAVQREVNRSRGLLVMHMFNHQTHHRGQAHAMLTAAGEATGDTDLWLMGG